MSLTYDELRAGVAGDAVGIRCRTVLQPLGGRGDKVFPPTYGVPDNAETRYAIEERYIPAENGAVVQFPGRWYSTPWRRRPTGLSWRCLMRYGEATWRLR